MSFSSISLKMFFRDIPVQNEILQSNHVEFIQQSITAGPWNALRADSTSCFVVTCFAGCICPFHTSVGMTEVTDHFDSNWTVDCCGGVTSGKRGKHTALLSSLLVWLKAQAVAHFLVLALWYIWYQCEFPLSWLDGYSGHLLQVVKNNWRNESSWVQSPLNESGCDNTLSLGHKRGWELHTNIIFSISSWFWWEFICMPMYYYGKIIILLSCDGPFDINNTVMRPLMFNAYPCPVNAPGWCVVFMGPPWL